MPPFDFQRSLERSTRGLDTLGRGMVDAALLNRQEQFTAQEAERERQRRLAEIEAAAQGRLEVAQKLNRDDMETTAAALGVDKIKELTDNELSRAIQKKKDEVNASRVKSMRGNRDALLDRAKSIMRSAGEEAQAAIAQAAKNDPGVRSAIRSAFGRKSDKVLSDLSSGTVTINEVIERAGKDGDMILSAMAAAQESARAVVADSPQQEQALVELGVTIDQMKQVNRSIMDTAGEIVDPEIRENLFQGEGPRVDRQPSGFDQGASGVAVPPAAGQSQESRVESEVGDDTPPQELTSVRPGGIESAILSGVGNILNESVRPRGPLSGAASRLDEVPGAVGAMTDIAFDPLKKTVGSGLRNARTLFTGEETVPFGPGRFPTSTEVEAQRFGTGAEARADAMAADFERLFGTSRPSILGRATKNYIEELEAQGASADQAIKIIQGQVVGARKGDPDMLRLLRGKVAAAAQQLATPPQLQP